MNDTPASSAVTQDSNAAIPSVIDGEPLAGKSVLIVVENLPLPLDRRVWQEARTLKAAGAQVSVICPKGKGFEKPYERIEGVEIYRHPLPLEAEGAVGFMLEYLSALFWETLLAWRIFFKHRFDAIQGCNPPDLIFLVALPFKLFGVKYIFDHHDINPELYEVKFGKRGFFWKLLRLVERWTFAVADSSIATNNSFKKIAIERGKMPEDHVHVVRSGPDLSRLKLVEPVSDWKNGRAHMVGYVGVMGEQEGIDLLIDSVEHIVRGLGREDIQFCLVGGGSSFDALVALTKERGLADYINFVGWAYGDTLLEVLSTMDVGVGPDRLNAMNDRSTMNKVMEYMALSKPSVQFALTEGRFSAGESSLYAENNDPVDFAEKIVELIDNPQKSAQMGAIGRRRMVDELNWQHQITPLLTAYTQALKLS